MMDKDREFEESVTEKIERYGVSREQAEYLVRLDYLAEHGDVVTFDEDGNVIPWEPKPLE